MFEKLHNFQGIIVTNNNIKKSILEYFYNKKELITFSFLSTNELVELVLGSFSIKTKVKLLKKYDLNMLSILLQNALLVDSESNNNKVNELYEISKLIDKSNDFELKKLIGTEILFINYYYDNDAVNKSIEVLQSNKISIKMMFLNRDEAKEIIINEYENIKDEVFETFKNIADLIYRGISLSNIYLYYVNGEYTNIIKEAMNLYKIPVNFNIKNSLIEYQLTKDILRDLEENRELKIDKFIINDDYKKGELLNKIISVLNKYIGFNYDIKDVLELIKFDFLNKKVNKTSLNIGGINAESINIISDINDYFGENKHLFVLGLNQNLIPKVHKDADYLSDNIKKELGIITSLEKNRLEKNKIINVLSTTKNVYISYSNNGLSNKLVCSSIINALKERFTISIQKGLKYENISYSMEASELEFSKEYNKFEKYGETSKRLERLYNYFEDRKYSSGNGLYKNEKIARFLEKGMILSYTSINEFFKCPYSFYLKRILKINKKEEDSRSLLIGNLFHDVFYNAFLKEEYLDESDIKKLMDDYYLREGIKVTKELELFNEIYLYYLYKAYFFIKSNSKSTLYKISSLEEEYNVNLKHGFILKGKIDKVLSYEEDGETSAIVIDYKTGSTKVDLHNIIYGEDLQLMIYFYFLNYDEKRGKVTKFAGSYLSHAIPNKPLPYEKGKDYEDSLNELFRYDGYTVNNREKLNMIDNTFVTGEEKSYIRGISLKSNGELKQTSLNHMIKEDEYDELLRLVGDKIDEVVERIYSCSFPISPQVINKNDVKRLDTDGLPCKHCNYRAICYVTEEDIVTQKPYKDFSFLKAGECDDCE